MGLKPLNSKQRNRLSPSKSLRLATLDTTMERSRASEGTRRATKGFAQPWELGLCLGVASAEAVGSFEDRWQAVFAMHELHFFRG